MGRNAEVRDLSSRPSLSFIPAGVRQAPIDLPVAFSLSPLQAPSTVSAFQLQLNSALHLYASEPLSLR